jgi:flagellar protein FliS
VEIRTASPEKLVVLLYEGAMQQARRARALHDAGKMGERGAAISRALAIVAELQQSLDLEAGGEIARNLRALYFFVTDRLLEANVTNRCEALDEALQVLGTLHEAWAEVARGGALQKAANE